MMNIFITIFRLMTFTVNETSFNLRGYNCFPFQSSQLVSGYLQLFIDLVTSLNSWNAVKSLVIW